jgi:hypothetical protein
MRDFLLQAKKLAYDEVERTGMPLRLHVDLACNVGRRLAKELGAHADIVEVGVLLMDCMIGQAIKDGKLSEHVQMSLDKANELIGQSSLSDADKENIRNCIIEHHGVKKFYSLESEICSNADCYRFTSTQGFAYAMRYLREMPFEDLIKLLRNKVDEKWGVLSLDTCKKELESQHKNIDDFLTSLENKME